VPAAIAPPAGLSAPLRLADEAAVFAARQCADRIEAGIRLLTDPAVPRHETALAAFRFANQAMALQRRHTAIGRLRASPMAKAREDGGVPGPGRVHGRTERFNGLVR